MASRPRTYRKLRVHKTSWDFRSAVKIETVPLCEPKEGEICIRNRYVGINADDINVSAGRYFTDGKVPYHIGFEGVGEISSVGSGVTNFGVGDAVVYLSSKCNSFAEYSCIAATDALQIPEAKPEYVALWSSSLTIAIGLDKCGRITNGETVLITAAAGGGGHIGVQWAKAAGCRVIGTCSTKEKEKVLKALGCDTVINYKEKDLGEVLAKEYPNGIDVIWETIGGKVFEVCLKHLANHGRLVVAGGTSGYKEDTKDILPLVDLSDLPIKLLFKSAALQGYYVWHYKDIFSTYFDSLVDKMKSGKIRIICDFGRNKELFGMEGIIEGVEYLHSGKSIGKVVVKI